MRTASKHDERVTKYALESHERPKYMYEYWVTGHGDFPSDMLRFDSCWPVTGADAAKVVLSCDQGGWRDTRSIKLRSYREPTIDRWSSFLWSVGERAVVLG
jgi:hypothetical protein